MYGTLSARSRRLLRGFSLPQRAHRHGVEPLAERDPLGSSVEHHAAAELRSEMQAGFAALHAEMHREVATLRSELTKWMFLFWVGTARTVIGLLKF